MRGERLALAQFTGRRFLRSIHVATCTGGPVWLVPVHEDLRTDIYQALRRGLPVPRPRAVFMTPDLGPEEADPLSAARLHRVMSPYSTALIDLTVEEATLQRMMRGKWRNRLRAAEQAGLRIQPGADAPGRYDWILAAEEAQQRARRYRATRPALTLAWHQNAGARDGVTILTAKRASQTVAAMLFLRHGDTARYHIGWANEEGRATSAHNLLLWRAMRKLKSMGLKTLDLGGLDTGPAAGIARFKLGSGAQPRTLCGTWG